ncbi:MAG: leucine-rich repeat domain-containing protein [Prevotellaceae bacterium]|jgi:hypothetical protein|nr:leucine-rich repeat domain-containing protein [Prevotellaceae bacterium]
MKTEKFFCTLLCSILLAAGAASAQTIASGTTGRCTWTLTATSNDCTLTISGAGRMGDYDYINGSAPWDSYQSSIKTLTIRQGITSIGDYAFHDCSGLTSVAIPNSVTSIGDYAFSRCSGLTSVDIPNSVTSIGESAFSRCSGLTSVDIPNSVKSIDYEAFYDCSGLTSVAIPNSVTSIGYEAFSGCSGLTSVAIPNSVTSIGRGAFSGCSGLKHIYVYRATPPTVDAYTFSYVTTCTLHVPSGSKGLYSAAEGWKEFSSIEESTW